MPDNDDGRFNCYHTPLRLVCNLESLIVIILVVWVQEFNFLVQKEW